MTDQGPTRCEHGTEHRPDQDEPSSGWDTHGNEFTIRDEPPYETRWRSLRGTAKEKLAAFDLELARQLEQRKITLPTAKSILLQRDVDAAAKRQVAELEKATAPYQGWSCEARQAASD